MSVENFGANYIEQKDISITTDNSDASSADPVVAPIIEQNDISITSDDPNVNTADPIGQH